MHCQKAFFLNVHLYTLLCNKSECLLMLIDTPVLNSTGRSIMFSESNLASVMYLKPYVYPHDSLQWLMCNDCNFSCKAYSFKSPIFMLHVSSYSCSVRVGKCTLKYP